ncbi:MAG: 2-oxoacid:acceptor oxidoreductase subunit alpha, partial [Candidatus Geothermincolia bacterium]
MDYTIKIGGEAGQGILTIGATLAKCFARCGYQVWSHQDYESRIRGGHNIFQIRFSDRAITCSRDVIDILIALDSESFSRHLPELAPSGIAIYDSAVVKTGCDDERCQQVPFEQIAMEQGKNRIMANMAAVGAALGLLGMQLDMLAGIVQESLGRKGQEVVDANLSVAEAAHQSAQRECRRCDFELAPRSDPVTLMEGAEAIGLGAIASGLRFHSGYPMTPSTPVMQYVTSKSGEYGIIVEQAEDEIAAINMVLGASFAGLRSMTATSGGGFSLMVEGLSLAAMTETPVVIAFGQRPAPATGFPTRTEQSDLLFIAFCAHGEFPRVIFAPGDHEQAFYLTNKAFDLAEKYQIPAFILYDQYYADILGTPPLFDVSRLRYTDYRMRGPVPEDYRRHAFTDTGVSPLAVPGEGPGLVFTDSDEHDEAGHIVEDAETRIKMV